MPGKKWNGSWIIMETLTIKHRLNSQYAPSFWGNPGIEEALAPLTAAVIVFTILGSHI